MPRNRYVEIFTAGCPVCQETVSEISDASYCEGCETSIIDTRESVGAERAKQLGVARLPAIAVDGKLLRCCKAGSIDWEELKKACS